MANASTVGALRVVLGLDSAAFEGGMTQAQAHLKRVGQQMQAVGGAMKIAGAAMVAAFVSAASGAATAVTVLSKNIVDLEAQAKTAGVSFEKFQSLKYAADRNSVSVAALTDGLKEMNLRADEFVKTGKGPGADAFKRLGIGAADLATRLKDPSALFEELLGRMQQLDKAGQIRVADEIFGGTGGEQFVRFLNMGVEGVRQLRAEFAKTGNLITPEQLAQSQRMQEAILNLKEALGNLSRALLDTGLVQWFVDVATGFTRLITKLNEAVPGFVKWASVVMVGVGALGALLVVAGTVVTSLGALTAAFAAAGGSATVASGGLAKFATGLTAIALHPAVIALTAVVGVFALLQWNAGRAGREAKTLAESLREQAAAAGLAADETGRLQTDLEANLVHVAAMTGDVNKLADAHFRAAVAIKAQILEQKRLRLEAANESLTEAQRAWESRRRRAVGEAMASAGDIDAYGRPTATSGLTADQRAVRSDEFKNLRNATDLVRFLTRDVREEQARDPAAYSQPGFEDLSGEGGKAPKGKTAEQLAQEAEQRRRAIEDMAATFNLQEAQLLNDQDRVKALEREEAVRQRTRALIDAGIETDRAAAGEEAERMQQRLDLALEQQTDKAFRDTQNALNLDIARTEESYELVRSLERQAEQRSRIEAYQRMGKDLEEATAQAAMDVRDIEVARAAAAQRRLADAREEHRLALAQLSGNERLTRQLQDQAEIRERTRRYQMEGNRSPVDAERRATNEVRLERSAARHGEAREMFSSAFSDGVRAAKAGDLKGFLSNQFGTFMSESFKRLGQQLYDSIFGTFDAVAEGTTQGTAQGLAAGPQIIAAGQGAAMAMGAAIRSAGAQVAAMMRAASAGGGGGLGGGAGSMPASIGRVASFLASLPGFANEGTIAASGASGIDSQLVAFWKSPREQVDIYQPGGRGSGGGGEMIHRVIVTPDRDSFITLAGEAAAPIAKQAATQMGRSVLDVTRRSAPGSQQSFRRLGAT